MFCKGTRGTEWLFENGQGCCLKKEEVLYISKISLKIGVSHITERLENAKYKAGVNPLW